MNEGHDLDKLDRIVNAALAVFSRRGFHRATMQDIAEEAGVGKGTTYLYFTSKDQLLEQIFDVAIEWYFGQMRESADLAMSGPERIRDLISRVLLGAHDQRAAASFLVEGSTGMSEEFKRKLGRFRARAHAAVRAVVATGIEAGDIRAVDADMLAHVIVGTVTSLVTSILWNWETLPGEGLPVDARVALLTDQAMQALAL